MRHCRVPERLPPRRYCSCIEQAKELETKKYWDPEFTSSYLSYREVSDEMLDAPVALALVFNMKDKPAINKIF